MLTILTNIFIASFVIQLAYYLSVYIRVLFNKKNEKVENFEPLTVIISARNEVENLRKFLPEILNQDYPDFEVLVINDNSEDDTNIVLNDLKHRYKNLRVLEGEKNKNGNGNKKKH